MFFINGEITVPGVLKLGSQLLETEAFGITRQFMSILAVCFIGLPANEATIGKVFQRLQIQQPHRHPVVSVLNGLGYPVVEIDLIDIFS